MLARSGYAHVPESPASRVATEAAPESRVRGVQEFQASPLRPAGGSLGRRLGAAAVGLATVSVLLYFAAKTAGDSPRRQDDLASAFLERLDMPRGGQGGCDWGENCAKTGCCKHDGFRCVETNEWWSVCKHVDDDAGDDDDDEPDDPAPAPAPEPECSKADEDCTESKCCEDAGYSCTKRTDGMWWKSTCSEGGSDDSGGDDGDDDDDEDIGGHDAGVIHAAKCGQHMPEDIPGQWKVAERCAAKIVERLSREEKLSMLHGTPGGMGYAGYIRIPRVEGSSPGTVRLTMNDGPQGYNGYTDPTVGKGTQFPDLIAIAASFDTAVAIDFGKAIAEEFRNKGCNVLLGPDVEVVRAPLAGRSFESLTGEDPFLGGQLAAAYVGEVHRHGLIATAKHWLDNEQEKHRQELDVIVGTRAQHEIYMPPFKAAIDAGTGAVMCSYNKVNGDYACENDELLNKLLREDLGFKGFVVSDWGAVHSGAKSVNGGLNIEMPEAKYFKDLRSVDDSTVDHLAGGILAAIYAAGQFHGRGPAIDWAWPPPFYHDATSDAHRETAKRIIIESTVLLKNSAATLPLASGTKIALVGKACHSEKDPAYGQGSIFSAGGSGYVATNRAITPFDGLKALVGEGSVTWSEQVSEARGADVIVICATAHDEEGKDRTSLEMPGAKDMIHAARAADSKQKVVMIAIVPGAVETDWIDEVDAALVMFMPGEQTGPAFAELITGKASPGGRLPLTFPKAGEHRFSEAQYPGVDLKSEMSEGVLVGYRWNDAMKQPAAFAFGFGLAYTNFEFSSFSATCNADGPGAKVTLAVKNTGEREGAAVPQLYVGFRSLRPMLRQLRGFVKLHLQPGAAEEVTFELGDEDWRMFDESSQRWRTATELGEEVEVSIGASSADLEWSGKLSCQSGGAQIRFQQ